MLRNGASKPSPETGFGILSKRVRRSHSKPTLSGGPCRKAIRTQRNDKISPVVTAQAKGLQPMSSTRDNAQAAKLRRSRKIPQTYHDPKVLLRNASTPAMRLLGILFKRINNPHKKKHRNQSHTQSLHRLRKANLGPLPALLH